MLQEIDEIEEYLRDGDRRAKINALGRMREYCSDKSVTSEQVHTLFESLYLHILKCYTDRWESVRNSAIEVVNVFVERIAVNDMYLASIVCTLMERMGSAETKEQSEEIRLLFIEQLHLLIKVYSTNQCPEALQENYADIVCILSRASRDPHPAVQSEVCACVSLLAKTAISNTFNIHAHKLASCIFHVLNHKHSQLRVAAVEALAELSLHIDAKGEMLNTIIMNVSPMLMDAQPLVRRQVGEMGTLLLLKLRDRYSYFDRLIPLVLCCLKDDTLAVSDYIRLLWHSCGLQYYKENELELNKQEISDEQPKNYPKNVRRPIIGCRGLVQRSLRLLPLITRESSDWKENVRLHSMKLLYQFVLHAEAAMTAKFFEIYPDLARACCDSEPQVVNEALNVADLMGRLMTYDDWSEHAFEGLKRNCKEGYLKCFYKMYSAAADATLADDLRVAEILMQPEFSHSLKLEMQKYVINMAETLLKKNFHLNDGNDKCDSLNNYHVEKGTKLVMDPTKQEMSLLNLRKNLYIVIVKVVALLLGNSSTESQLLIARCEELLIYLSKSLQLLVDDLHNKYMGEALSQVEGLDALLEDNTEPILLLHGLIVFCKLRVNAIPVLVEQVKLVWEHCTAEAKVKICHAISVAMLEWHQTIKLQLEDSAELLLHFLEDIITQHLEWQAGANAEAMRSMATATLAAVSQGAPLEAQIVLPVMYAEHMPRLLEDRVASTRHYAIKCLCNFGPTKMQHMKLISYGVLQRLDDPSENIREIATIALTRLVPNFSEEKEERASEEVVWAAFIEKTFDLLFLHYESPELRLKAAIKNAIINLAPKYADICKKSLKKCMEQSYSKSSLELLLKDLTITI